ncbi:MAG: hypothetical protein AAF514_24160, partial [Verrucomicrobiota bacterium]
MVPDEWGLTEDLAVSLAPLRAPNHDYLDQAFDLGNEVPVSFSGREDGARQGSEADLEGKENYLWWEWEAPETGLYRFLSPSGASVTVIRLVTRSGPAFGGVFSLEAGDRVNVGLAGAGRVEGTIQQVAENVEANLERADAVDLGVSDRVTNRPFVLGGRTSVFSRGSGFTGWWHWTPTVSGKMAFKIARWTGDPRTARMLVDRGEDAEVVLLPNLIDGDLAFYLDVFEGEALAFAIHSETARTFVGGALTIVPLERPAN